MGHRTSRTLERAVRQDEASAAIDALRKDHRLRQIELARLFHDVERSSHFVFEMCSSVGQFGEKHGFSSREARTLAAAGRAFALNAEIEERLLAGRITFDAAAALGKVYEDPRMVKEGEDWLEKAEKLTLPGLEREIKERIVEVHRGGPTSKLFVVMTVKARRTFERAREVACQKEGKILDEGQAIEVISDFYLDAFDEERAEERSRRMPDTTGMSGRTIPAAVRRELRSRGGVARCQFPGCDNRIWLQACHRKPHANGGSREADNLLLMCGLHHDLFDRGLIRVKGPSEDPEFYVKALSRSGKVKWQRVTGARGPPPG